MGAAAADTIIGRTILEEVETASGFWPVPPSLFALCVYRSNAAAIQLYKSAGYVVDDSWLDPRWLHYAERGYAGGPPRRLLMTKKVASWVTDDDDDV